MPRMNRNVFAVPSPRKGLFIAPSQPTIGTAQVTLSPASTLPAAVTTPSSLVLTLGQSVTVTYCVTGAVSAWLDKHDGTTIPLVADGTQHTVTFTPVISGDFQLHALDSMGGEVIQPLPFVVQQTLPALDPTAPATVTSAGSGDWAEGSTWIGGVVPGRDDIVQIQAGHSVTTSGRGDQCGRLLVAGTVTVLGGALLVSDIDVQSTGTFTVDATAFDSTGAAIVLLRNRPQDANDTAGNSPDGFANFWPALNVRSGGTLKTRSANKTPFVRLAVEPHAGDTQLSLASPVSGWKVGDRIIVPDSRQLAPSEQAPNFVHKFDLSVVRGVSADGLTVYLLNPLLYNHPGAYDLDGNLKVLPHVFNPRRSAGFVTSDPTTTTTRAHAFAQGRAVLDCVGGLFHGLGRTLNTDPNEPHRHSFYLENVIGPVSPLSHGDQWHFEQCSFMEPWPVNTAPKTRWGFGASGSFYGTLKDCISFMWQGAGLGLFDGVSSFNTVSGNFSCWVEGSGLRADTTLAGSVGAGFWFAGPNNYVSNNVATMIGFGQAEQQYGFVWFCNVQTCVIPSAQGQDPNVSGTTVNYLNQPLPLVSNNEAYGATARGWEFWYINSREVSSGSGGTSTFDGFKVWGIHEMLCFPYYSNNATINNLQAYSSLASVSGNYAPVGINNTDYLTQNLVMQNSHIEGFTFGLVPSTQANSLNTTATVQNCTLRNVVNVALGERWGSGGYSQFFGTRTTILANNTYLAPPGKPLIALDAEYEANPVLTGKAANLMVADTIYLNGYGGHNYQVYFVQQAPSFVLPDQTYDAGTGFTALTASIAGGQTNQYLHDHYQPWDQNNPTGILKSPPNSATPGLCAGNALAPAGAVNNLTGVTGWALQTS